MTEHDKTHARESRANKPSQNPFTLLLDRIGNVWFGISMMVGILVYCWLASAGLEPFIHWLPRHDLEMTEMEVFAWWPLQVLVGLLCLSLTIVTIRRIKFTLPNLGVWTVHAGIIILVLGALVYFGMKLEGDVPVFRRQVVLSAEGGELVALPLQPGARVSVGAGERGHYEVRVVDLVHDYELLTGADAGKRTYAAQLSVTPRFVGESSEPFIRQVLDGYPEYTEDVLPGRGRAVKVLGQPIIDDAIRMEMTYHDPQRIFLHHRRALHVRPAGTNAEWSEGALRGLPRYHEYLEDPGDKVFVAPGEGPLLARPLSLDPEWDDAAALLGYEFRVTGFMPYATLRTSWARGGARFNPYVRFALDTGEMREVRELLARVPGEDSIAVDDEFGIYFKWVEDAAELEELMHPGDSELRVRVPKSGSEVTVPLARALEGPVAVGESGFTVHVTRIFPQWTTSADKEKVSMALVKVEGPGKSFSRAVITPRKDLSQDLDASGHMTGGRVDPSIDIELSALPRAGLTLIAGPLGQHVVLTNASGAVEHVEAPTGEQVELLEGALRVTLLDVVRNAERVEVPFVVPMHNRNRKANDAYSLVQIELSRDGQSTRRWVEYSHYNHPSRSGYRPARLQVAGGPPIEVVYSRETHPLPAPVALEEFKLETYPGGERERDFISLVRFYEDGAWSGLHEVRSNQPTEHAGWWYYQATWDPPDERSGYAGMFYTGLGVGNRHGVLTMLLGSFLTVSGTIWAFYVKPIILRRRRERRQAEIAGARQGVPDEPARPAANAVARVETP